MEDWKIERLKALLADTGMTEEEAVLGLALLVKEWARTEAEGHKDRFYAEQTAAAADRPASKQPQAKIRVEAMKFTVRIRWGKIGYVTVGRNKKRQDRMLGLPEKDGKEAWYYPIAFLRREIKPHEYEVPLVQRTEAEVSVIRARSAFFGRLAEQTLNFTNNIEPATRRHREAELNLPKALRRPTKEEEEWLIKTIGEI